MQDILYTPTTRNADGHSLMPTAKFVNLATDHRRQAERGEDEGKSFMERTYKFLFFPRGEPLTYRLVDNLKSGFTVPLVNVPLSISLAIAGGATPSQGIVTAFWAGIVSAFFCSSHFNVVGPTGALASMLSSLGMRYGPAVFPVVALYTGLFLMVFVFFRLDRHMRYVSLAVEHGFSLGVAAIIAIAQIAPALGLTKLVPRDNIVDKVKEAAEHLPNASPADTLFFFANLIPLFILAGRYPKVPWAIVFSVIGITFSYFNPGVVNVLASKYPHLELSLVSPVDFSKFTTFLTSWHVILYSGGVAIVALMETLISASISNEMVSEKQGLRYSTKRESIGLALSNLAVACFGGIPATAALARSALNVRSGAWSRLSNIIGSCILAVFSTLLLDWFTYLPMPTIAALLMLVAYRLVNFKELSHMRAGDLPGAYICLITLGVCIIYDTFFGLVAGSLVSVMADYANMGVSLVEVIHPQEDNDTEYMAVIRTSIIFVNADEVMVDILKIIKNYPNGSKLIISLEHCYRIDSDGAHKINTVIEEIEAAGWEVELIRYAHVAHTLEGASLEHGARHEEDQHLYSPSRSTPTSTSATALASGAVGKGYNTIA